MTTRRDAIRLGAGFGLMGGIAAAAPALGQPAISQPVAAKVNRLGAWRRGLDGQRRANLGDGHYLNPVFAGDHAEPTVLRDGEDYYICFASADYFPGPVIWRSRNLIDWSPLAPVLAHSIGCIRGPELVCHDGRYFLYMTVYPFQSVIAGDDAARRASASIMVTHADRIEGPWSVPVDIGLRGRADPGHIVTRDGTRHLFLDNGNLVGLAADGLSVRGVPRQVYKGWQPPNEFINEGFSLEAAKVIWRDGYYYLFAAECGTTGPANGHLVAVARARTIEGPWENSPHNPLVRADARDDPWWSRGRAVPVEGPDGRWWIVYHGYEKNLRSMGRQTLLEPMEWNADGWPRALGGILDAPMPAPGSATVHPHGIALGGPFRSSDLGTRFAFYQPRPMPHARAQFRDGSLLLKGQGDGPAASSPLAIIAGDRRYELSIRIAPEGASEAGLLLFYDDQLFCGLSSHQGRLRRYKLGHEMTYPPAEVDLGGEFDLKIVYKEDVASFFVRTVGSNWWRVTTFDVAGYNPNMSHRLLSLRPALFVAGKGAAHFRDLEYNGSI